MDFISEKWDEITDKMRNEFNISNVSFETWIKPLKECCVKEDVVYIIIPDVNAGMSEYINSKYKSLFQVTISEMFDHTYNVEFVIEKDVSSLLKGEEFTTPSPVYNINYEAANLNPKYKFDTFVVGSNNKFAHSACLAVAESPGKAYNPLYLYGGAGLGKTHLMHAIGNKIKEDNPSARITYVTSETFTNELIQSIQDNTNAQFRNKYRNVDVLMIDDVQFIAGKNTTQEEFFNTFNTLHTSGRQIVISSDKPPKEIPALEERLRSRFEGGLITDIQSPDYETRMAILQKKADQENIIIDPRVLSLIATKANANIRQLEGAFTRVVAFSKLLGTPITLSMADSALKDIIEDVQERRVTVPMVQQVVADFYSVSVDAMTSSRRTADVTYPRQVAMYLSREMTDLSLKAIGEQFGGRNYSTIISACNKIEDDMRFDPELSKVFKDLKKRIKGN